MPATDAYFFDFDCTITKRHTYADSTRFSLKANVWNIDESTDEDVRNNTKNGFGKAFKRILANGHYLAIVTNSDQPALIKRYLRVAGLSEQDISQIEIRHPERANGSNPQFKKVNILQLLRTNFKDAKNAYYYEDDPRCLQALADESNNLKDSGVKLNAIAVPGDNPEYCDHFDNILSKYLSTSSYAGSTDVGMFARQKENAPLLNKNADGQVEQNNCCCIIM